MSPEQKAFAISEGVRRQFAALEPLMARINGESAETDGPNTFGTFMDAVQVSDEEPTQLRLLRSFSLAGSFVDVREDRSQPLDVLERYRVMTAVIGERCLTSWRVSEVRHYKEGRDGLETALVLAPSGLESVEDRPIPIRPVRFVHESWQRARENDPGIANRTAVILSAQGCSFFSPRGKETLQDISPLAEGLRRYYPNLGRLAVRHIA